MQVNKLEGSYSAPPSVPSKQLIAEWSRQEITFSLFYESSQNRFAFTDKRLERSSTFKSTLYDKNSAVSLTSMFHQTIGVNLERESLNGACFLPKVCLEASQTPDVQVGLFGHVDTRTHAIGEVKWLRWGVFHLATREEQTFEVRDDDLVKNFLHRAPNTNRSHLVRKLNKNGESIEVPASDHYAITNYIKRFSVVLIRDAHNRIQKVALHHASLLDKNVILDENNWAVTLVSTLDSTPTCNSLFRGKFGHAMLACEGIEHDKRFLRYLHLTQKPRNKNSALNDDEAQIECLDQEIPYLDTLNGPTWRRSKNLVENMFAFVVNMKGVPLKFAIYGAFVWTRSRLIEMMGRYINEQDLNGAMNYPPQLRYVPLTCFDGACEIAKKGGMILYENSELIRPIEKIKKLKLGEIVYLSKGKPCFVNDSSLSARIVAASALLTDNDCSLEECELWALRWVMESLKGRSNITNLINIINVFATKCPPEKNQFMGAKSIEQAVDSLFPRIPLAEVTNVDRKTEQIALRKFLFLKALNLSVVNFGRSTGWIGRVCGILMSHSKEDAEEKGDLCYQITSIPGKFVGLINTPILGLHLNRTRNLIYTSSQVDKVGIALKNLLDHGNEENFQAFRQKMEQVIRAYGQSVFATSRSSNVLISHAMSRMPNAELVKEIYNYLTAREVPLSIMSWHSQQHPKNQGKRLFNIIMKEFSTFSTF